jgi:hypothetical protein
MIMRAFLRSLLLLAALLLFAAPATAAKSYTADRFDVRARILDNGAMEVVETVVVRFESGTFTYVFRDLSRQRTDDIEFVSAAMDGRDMPLGKGAGFVEVRNGSKVRVRWNFAPRAESSHTFTLTYVVRGVVQRQGALDVLEWTALPREHDYRIAQSDIVFDLPKKTVTRPAVVDRRIGSTSVEPGEDDLQIVARNIRRDGWLRARLEFNQGDLIVSAPAWQQHQLAARATAPRWATAAGIILVAGLIFLFGLRQRYDSPRSAAGDAGTVTTPPDKLSPGVGGALAANGSVSLNHALATLFALADRGVVTIVEEPRRWGQRHFALQRNNVRVPLSREDETVLELAFRHKGQQLDTTPMTPARNRIASGLRTYRATVTQELRALGMLDEERMGVRSRYQKVAIALLITAALLVAPAVFLVRQYEGWPFLIVGAVAVLGVVALIFYGALTPLSNEGVRRAERWRAYQRHLKDVARAKEPLTSGSVSTALPFAVALGLAGLWSKYFKTHPAGTPAWFRALSVAGDDGAFPAFILAGGAEGGAGVPGGGGAAGGGASGAG